MKRLMVVTSIVSLAGIAGAAVANCTDNQVKNADITSLVSGKTVCATQGGDKWQEYHSGSSGANNNLIDWKKGTSDPIDPTTPVGSWSTTTNGNNSSVIYNYGSGGIYVYKVYAISPTVAPNAGNYTYCGISSAPTLNVTIQAGQGPCP